MRAFLLLNVIALAVAQYNYLAPSNRDEVFSSTNVQPQSVPQPAPNLYNKEFFSYEPPEAEFEPSAASSNALNSLRKGLRVVFIKTPEDNSLEKAVLQMAKAASEDHTVIYVLKKQADVANLANQLNSLKSNEASKPEVHYVKYKTEQDAENAKRTIQSQYDTLPGSSAAHRSESGPVLDFSSSHTQEDGAGSLASSSNQVSNAYLPPAPPSTIRF